MRKTCKPTLQQFAAFQERGIPFCYWMGWRIAKILCSVYWICILAAGEEPTHLYYTLSQALGPMLSKQFLHVMSTGQVNLYYEPGHPIEARKLYIFHGWLPQGCHPPTRAQGDGDARTSTPCIVL